MSFVKEKQKTISALQRQRVVDFHDRLLKTAALRASCFVHADDDNDDDEKDVASVHVHVLYTNQSVASQPTKVHVPVRSIENGRLDRCALAKMQCQLQHLATEKENGRRAQMHLQHNEMIECLSLEKTAERSYELCILLHQADNSKPDVRTEMMDLLQQIVAACVAWSLGGRRSQHRLALNRLTLFMFAWIVNLSATLCKRASSEKLELLLLHNLIRFDRANTEKNKLYFHQFAVTIACKCTAPLQHLLGWLKSSGALQNMRSFVAHADRHAETNKDDVALCLYRDPRVEHTANLLALVEQVTPSPKPPLRDGSLNRHNDHRHDGTKTNQQRLRSQATRSVVLVEAFVNFITKLCDMDARALVRGVECCVVFDETRCTICTVDGKYIDNGFQTIVVRRGDDVSRMKLDDLSEWLKHMVLLSLDKRNVHQDFVFQLKLLDHKHFDFSRVNGGMHPYLSFHNATGLLVYYLIFSEFVRASYTGKRSHVYAMRDEMLANVALGKFVQQEQVTFSLPLMEHVCSKYALKYVQGLSTTCFQ